MLSPRLRPGANLWCSFSSQTWLCICVSISKVVYEIHPTHHQSLTSMKRTSKSADEKTWASHIHSPLPYTIRVWKASPSLWRRHQQCWPRRRNTHPRRRCPLVVMSRSTPKGTLMSLKQHLPVCGAQWKVHILVGRDLQKHRNLTRLSLSQGLISVNVLQWHTLQC
jgi:hypothetical protein